MDFRESFYSAVIDGSSSFADLIRTSCTDMMKSQIPDSPELWEKLTPDYNPGCKRVIISDDFYPCLASPKCTLETTRIARITETGIETSNGTHHAHSTLILATGFQTTDFLHPIRITGTQGKSLTHDIWSTQRGVHALYGTTVPSLPNFALLYGPNTNLGHNSIILMIEAQSRYISTLVAAVLDARARGGASVEGEKGRTQGRIGIMPREERTRMFNEEMQSTLQQSSFADDRCASWYKDAQGRVTNNWSGTVVQYQELLGTVDWEDFEVFGAVVGGLDGNDGGEQVGGLSENVAAGVMDGHDGHDGHDGPNNTTIRASKVVFGTGKQSTRIGRVREESLVSNTVLALGVVGALAAGAAWVWRGKVGRKSMGIGGRI